MKKINTLGTESALFILQENQRNFDAESLQKTSEALKNLNLDFPSTEASVIDLHEALLFSIAYPGSEAILQQCNSLMALLVQTVTKTVSKNRNAYYNSGITGSLVCAQFGLLLNQYLLAEKLQTLELSGVDGHNSELVGKLTFTLDSVEQELMPDDAGYFNKWQKRYLPGIKSSKNLLDYYIHACMQMQGSIAYKESVFQNFQLFTEFSLDAKLLGLSNGRLGIGSNHIHTHGIQKKCTIEEVFLQGKPKQIKLQANQQAHLVRLARGSMASLLRETDTFSYAQEHETELHDMGNGICIGLYFMIPEQKFALQSYIGYLLYKNGLPMAYGGCWLFAQQAAFGVNVLPPYRGGESSNVVAQLLRLYHFRFGVQQFTVDPYQIGKGNSDGIQSGAFWFYYKLGFRPMQQDLADLAKSEMLRMTTEKGYRSPAKILVKLADAEIYWAPSTNNTTYYSLLPISDKISAHIAKSFNGNRNLALIAATKKYQKMTQVKVGKNSFLNRLLVTLDAIGVFEKLKPAVVTKIAEAYQQKDKEEANAHLKLRALKAYWQLFK
jgi:hypothetical protein